jgi:tripartite ATP-independent transporter DctM subunit
MAAVAGSSAVTCATVGRMSIPELKKRGYDEALSIGTLAGSGTLGLLIPPSIMLIVYGVIAQQSISRMFIAGVLPGIVIIAIFMTYVMIRTTIDPSLAPKETERTTLRQKLWASRLLIPVMLLIFVVIGSIYGGFATPTEAATVGVIGALVLAWWSKSLTWASFMEALMGAVRTSCMIAFILAGAAFLSIAMGFTGVPRVLAGYVDALDLSPTMLLVVLTILYIFLGCFLDGVSMMVLTAAVVLPMVKDAGIDLVWFGIFTVIVVEMAQITPPVGFNLFVLQGMTGRDILQVTKASIPFFFLMLLGIVVITAVPELALWPVQWMVAAR